MFNPLDIRNYSREHLIEQIMAFEGRAADDPRKVRSELERLPIEELLKRHNQMLEAAFAS